MILNNRLVRIVIAVLILLLIPLIAMQFTDEVNWTLSDFVIAGFLLLGFGFLSELIIRKVKRFKHRLIIFLFLLLFLIFIWIELAVGLIGSPLAGS